MNFRAALSASKALWHRSLSKAHASVRHKDSDGAATATTAKSSSCGTADEPNEDSDAVAAAAATPPTSSTSSLVKLAKAVSMKAMRSSGKEEGRHGGEVKSVSSNSLSTGCRTGPLQPGDSLRRQITGPFLLEDTDRSYIEDDDNSRAYDDEAGLRRIHGHPFEMTEEDKRVILSCLAHQHHGGGGADGSIRRTLSAGSFATPQYRVEICAKGLEDDDTLDGIMTSSEKRRPRPKV
jgi:hypothetical protein